MKKFLLFLTLLVSAIGFTHAEAEEPSYTITFKESGNKGDGAEITAKTNLTDIISVGTDYVSNISGLTKVYIAKGTYGIKIGQASASGNITFNLSDAGNVTATKIVISAAAYNSSSDKQGTLFVYLNDNATENFKQKLTTTSLSNIIIPLSPATELSSIKLGADKYIHVKSITVYYKEGTDCGIAFSRASDSVEYPGTNYSLPFTNDNNVDVTFTSTKPGVATVANESNMPKLTINGCGTTTITASFAGNEEFGAKEVSFTLTVIDPNDKSVTDVVTADAFNKDTGTTYTDVSYTSTATETVYSAKVIIETKSNVNTFRINDPSKSFFCVSTAPTNYRLSKIVLHKVYGSKSVKIYASTTAYTAAALSSGTNPGGTLVQTTGTGIGDYTIEFTTKDNYVAFYVVGPDGSTNFSSIDVTWEPLQEGDIKADPGLAFAEATVNKVMGDAAFTNPLTKPDGLTISYATDPAESTVATVDANGEVTILAAGTVTILASSAETETYKAGSASYTLKVIDTKRTDTFNASNLIFDEGSDYRNFTYTGASGAVYGGFADANESTLMIKNQPSGKSGIFVSQAPEGYKLHTITVSTATGSADLTLYGSTKPYASVSTDGKSIATIESGKKNEIFVNGYPATLGAYGIIPTTFSICGADNASSVTEITVTWELDIREEAKLAYATTEVTLAEGETLTQPKLNNPNTLPVTYSTDNAEVATVTAEGTIALAGATGSAVITASTDGNASYKPASTTFTITVREPIDQVANFSLVKNINDLHVGDIIVIACPEKTKVMSTEETADYRPSVIATFSEDNNTLTTPADGLQLQVEKSEDGFWMLRTTNYLGTNGYLSSSSENKAKKCIISETVTDYTKATITLSETGVATILFNKGKASTTEVPTWLTYNNTNNASNEGRFSCYAATFSGKDIFIYKFESNQTTIYDSDNISQTFVETAVGENSRVKLTYRVLTESTAEKLAVLVDGTKVAEFANNEGIVDITLDGVPYLPESEFTICPIYTIDAEGNTTLGHPETLNFTWAELPVLDFTSKKMELFFDSEAYKDDLTCSLDAWVFLTIDMKDATTRQALDEADPRRNLTFSFEEFKNSVPGVEIWGWYTPYKEVQWCKYDYFTNVPVADGKPDTAGLNNRQTISLSFNAYFTFNVTPELSSLIPSTTRMEAPARAGEADVIQTVAQTAPLKFMGKWPESLDSVVSGVEGVTVDANAPVEFFNLQGVRVDGDLAPGIYIRRQGQTVSKVQIR